MPRNLGTKGFNLNSIMPATFYVPVAPGGSTSSVSSPTTSVMYAIPWVPARTGTITAVGLNVTTGVASSVLRLGIYNNGAGIPGTLLADWGTVSAATSGMKTITGLSTAFDAKIYWVVAVAQTVGGTAWRSSTYNNVLIGQPVGTPVDQMNCSYITSASVTGALPGSFSVASTGTFAPCIHLKV